MTLKILIQSGRHRRARREAGMTLAEVVVALLISGLAVAGIINGYNYCATSSQKAALSLAANALAMQRLEQVRSATWDTASWPAVDELVATNFPSVTETLDMSGSGTATTSATVQTEISQISTNPPLKAIRVSCIWRFKGSLLMTNIIETFRGPKQ